MVENGAPGRRRLSRAARDLAAISAITLAALAVVYALDVSGRIDVLVREIGMRGLHNVFATSVILVAALAAYSVLRWRESVDEIRKRIRVEEQLEGHQEDLERTVEKRTAALRKVNDELEQEIAERRQAEKFLGTMFHSIRDPFSIIDKDFKIVRANDAYAQMRGRPVDELVGARCHEILREKNAVCDDCIVEKTFASGDPCAKEKPCSTHKGMWVEIFTYPISDTGGRVSHVIEYIRDITGRKRSEEERSQLIRKLEQISMTDALTGLFNRRAIAGALDVEVERALRYGSELSVLVCDIDYFKDANDAYGHKAGDDALVLVAQALSDIARQGDLIGRYGGDEFMLVLPETGRDGAMKLSERVLSAVRDTQVRLAEGGAFSVTLSVGVAGFAPRTDDAELLIRRADKALYASKHAGRNKITFGG